MKRKAMILILAAGILLLAVPVFAITPQWTTTFTVTGVQAGYSDGHVLIYGASGTSFGCAGSGILAKSGSADTARMANLATAALLSGRKLNCWVNACDTASDVTNWARVDWCELLP